MKCFIPSDLKGKTITDCYVDWRDLIIEFSDGTKIKVSADFLETNLSTKSKGSAKIQEAIIYSAI